MTVETNPLYPSDLNATLPLAGDPKVEGDDHLRNLKTVFKTTFPNVSGAVTPTHTVLNYMLGVTSGVQAQIDLKAPLAAPTFTGVVVLPATTSIGTVSATELGYLDGVTSAVQAQIDLKAPLASPALTGVPTAPTAATGTNTTQLATTAFVVSTGLSSALPGQPGNAGKTVTTDGTTATWATVESLQTAASQAEMEAGTEVAIRSVSPLRVKQAITAIAVAGSHRVRVTTGNGSGSTNTACRRFTTVAENVGTAITYADSATLGATFTINEPGLFAVELIETNTASIYAGATVNGIALTGGPTGEAIGKRVIWGSLSVNMATPMAAVARFVAGDVVRMQLSGAATATGETLTMFSIRKIGA